MTKAFERIRVVPFQRQRREAHNREGLVVAHAALETARPAIESFVGPVLCIAWQDAAPDVTGFRDLLGERFTLAVCPHGGGPPVCWCRPPLPGLVAVWMRQERIDPTASRFFGTGPVHRALAGALGFVYAQAEKR